MVLMLHPYFWYLIISNIHGKIETAKRDLTASGSPAFDNDKVSATINDALTKAGFDADEADSFRAGYHVAVDQFDDNEDESRKLLSDTLLKVLDYDDVEKVDGTLDVLGDKADGLIPRDVDTTAGSKDGVKPTGHVVVADSSSDIASRDVDPMAMAELMATLTLAKGHQGNAWLPGTLKDPRDEHAGKHDNHGSQPEKREESVGHADPEPIEPVKEPERKIPPGPIDVDHLRPTPTEVLAWNPFLAQFKDMDLLDTKDKARAATAEDVDRILSLFQNLNSTKLPGSNPSLTDSNYAKLNFLERLKEMGLLKRPKETRIMTIAEFFQAWESYSLKVNKDRNMTLPSDTEAPTKVQGKIPIQAMQSHSKRSVPEVPGCDCQTTIDAVKEPKPEGGMTYAWFQDWKHKDMNTNCIRPCVDKAIDHFEETVRKYQAFEAQFGAGLKNPPGLSKRAQLVDPSEPAKAEVPTVKNEPPKSGGHMTYRDWYEATQKTGELCTCYMQTPPMWAWVVSIYGKSQRCIKFCSQSVKPFLDKEKEKQTPIVPQEPSANATAVEEPVEGASPSGESAPGVISVPISQGPKSQPQRDTPDLAEDEK